MRASKAGAGEGRNRHARKGVPTCVDESITIEIRLQPQAAVDTVVPGEVELLSSILSELMLSMIQAEDEGDQA